MEWISLGLTLPVFFYAGAPFLRAAARGLRAPAASTWTRSSCSGPARRSSTARYQMLARRRGLLRHRRDDPDARAGRGGTSRRARGGAPPRRWRGWPRLAPREARAARARRGRARGARAACAGRGRSGRATASRWCPASASRSTARCVEGASEVDEALVTGEARPVAKAPRRGGDRRHASTCTARSVRRGDARRRGRPCSPGSCAPSRRRRPRSRASRRWPTGWSGCSCPAMLLLAAATVACWLARGAPVDQALMTGISVRRHRLPVRARARHAHRRPRRDRRSRPRAGSS